MRHTCILHEYEYEDAYEDEDEDAATESTTATEGGEGYEWKRRK